jgi:hypothetical protein
MPILDVTIVEPVDLSPRELSSRIADRALDRAVDARGDRGGRGRTMRSVPGRAHEGRGRDDKRRYDAPAATGSYDGLSWLVTRRYWLRPAGDRPPGTSGTARAGVRRTASLIGDPTTRARGPTGVLQYRSEPAANRRSLVPDADPPVPGKRPGRARRPVR